MAMPSQPCARSMSVHTPAAPASLQRSELAKSANSGPRLHGLDQPRPRLLVQRTPRVLFTMVAPRRRCHVPPCKTKCHLVGCSSRSQRSAIWLKATSDGQTVLLSQALIECELGDGRRPKLRKDRCPEADEAFAAGLRLGGPVLSAGDQVQPRRQMEGTHQQVHRGHSARRRRMFRRRAEDIRLATAENAREQRHDREGRRGSEI